MQIEKFFIIDRIEGDFAVCEEEECGDIWNIQLSLISDALEGQRISVLTREIDGITEIESVKVVLSLGRKEKNKERLKSLFNKSERDQL